MGKEWKDDLQSGISFSREGDLRVGPCLQGWPSVATPINAEPLTLIVDSELELPKREDQGGTRGARPSTPHACWGFPLSFVSTSG